MASYLVGVLTLRHQNPEIELLRRAPKFLWLFALRRRHRNPMTFPAIFFPIFYKISKTFFSFTVKVITRKFPHTHHPPDCIGQFLARQYRGVGGGFVFGKISGIPVGPFIWALCICEGADSSTPPPSGEHFFDQFKD